MFISLEGIDGSGKTSLLKEFFLHDELVVHVEKFPTEHTTIGKETRALLNQSPFSYLDFFHMCLIDMYMHYNKIIKPLLAKGVPVIADRYLHSSLAYGLALIPQEDAPNLDYETIVGWIYNALQLPNPDITFLLDIEPSIAAERLQKRGLKSDIIEKLANMELVRQNYLQLIKDPRLGNIEKINALKPTAELARYILKRTKHFGK